MSCTANRNKAAKAAAVVGVAELANQAAALKPRSVGPQSKWAAIDRAFGQYRRRFVADKARLFNQAIQAQRRVTVRYRSPGQVIRYPDLIPLDIRGGQSEGNRHQRYLWLFSEKRKLPLALALGRVEAVEVGAGTFEPEALEKSWGRKNRGYTLPRPWGRTAAEARKRKGKPAAASGKKRTTAVITAVADLDWEQRQLLDGGGAGVIYRVGPGVVAKVGRVTPDEVEAQRHFARQGLAVPVLAYQAEVELPAAVSREVCSVHGSRREILPEGERCTCGQPQGVLVMPEADCVSEIPAEPRRAFIMGFSRDAEEQLGLTWDARPQNMAYYQGRLVALDFGH